MPKTCMAWTQNMSRNAKVEENRADGETELQHSTLVMLCINNYGHM
jgi:hypothetical protein